MIKQTITAKELAESMGGGESSAPDCFNIPGHSKISASQLFGLWMAGDHLLDKSTGK